MNIRLGVGFGFVLSLALGPVSQAPRSRPEPVRIQVPFPGIASAIEFTGRVRAEVVGGGVASTAFEGPHVDSNGGPLFPRHIEIASRLSQAAVRNWKFRPGSAGSFETLLTHRRVADPPCGPGALAVVTAVVPSSIDVVSFPHMICDPTVRVTKGDPVTVSFIEGHVRCEDCPSRDVISGASVVLYQPDGDRGQVRAVRTDSRGDFRIGQIPEGRYRLAITARAYSTFEVAVVVSAGSDQAPIDVRLEREPSRRRVAPDAWVESADLATYPADARSRGIQGLVKIRLSATDGEVTDVDIEAIAPELGRAAEANVRTWNAYVRVPVLTVTYTYRLLSGDCGPDQQPRVVMRFPHDVEVMAKRVVPCRP